jgi:hypothetical protein
MAVKRRMGRKAFFILVFVKGESPGNADVQVVEVVVVVPEIRQMQTELFIAQREVFHTHAAIEIVMAGGKG